MIVFNVKKAPEGHVYPCSAGTVQVIEMGVDHVDLATDIKNALEAKGYTVEVQENTEQT